MRRRRQLSQQVPDEFPVAGVPEGRRYGPEQEAEFGPPAVEGGRQGVRDDVSELPEQESRRDVGTVEPTADS